MNIVERLDMLMQNKGINKNQLSKGANIPYTTIDGLYKKGSENIKLTTLIKLADYFNISIDYLIGRGEEMEYSLDELNAIREFQQFLKFKRGVNNGQN